MCHTLPPSTLLYLLALLSLFSCSQHVATALPAPQMLKVCGRQLANMLSIVCRGKYYHTGKRSVEDEDSISDLTQAYSALLKRQISDSDQFQRVTKGIYDECCKEKCKLSTLQAYCE